MLSYVNLSLGDAGIMALTGYLVVFLGIVLLMGVVYLIGRIMTRKQPATQPAVQQGSKQPLAAEAPGTAGELKLYGTDPRTAAMIMAIVADEMGVPVNTLRFISIKEVP